MIRSGFIISVFVLICLQEVLCSRNINFYKFGTKCRDKTAWQHVSYESVGLEPLQKDATTLIRASKSSCMTSPYFVIKAGSTLEFSAYLNTISDDSGITILVYDQLHDDVPVTNYTYHRNSKDFVTGWNNHSIKMKKLIGGYVILLGFSQEDEIVVIDSFRYVSDKINLDAYIKSSPDVSNRRSHATSDNDNGSSSEIEDDNTTESSTSSSETDATTTESSTSSSETDATTTESSTSSSETDATTTESSTSSSETDATTTESSTSSSGTDATTTESSTSSSSTESSSTTTTTTTETSSTPTSTTTTTPTEYSSTEPETTESGSTESGTTEGETETPEPEAEETGLKPWEITLIVLGTTAGVGLIGFLIYYFVIKP